jgi:phage-related protein
MNAYRLPVENKNDKISGSFPTIPSGSNTIGITGTYTKVEITPNYFTI